MRRIFKYLRFVLPLLFVVMVPLKAVEVSHAAPKNATEQTVSATPESSPDVSQEQTDPTIAQLSPDVSKQTDPVTAKLLSENKSIEAGQPFWVAVELKMQPGWDTYWQNPGDAGIPTKIDWKLPQGFHAGPIQWPYPEKISDGTMTGYGYTDSVTLLTEITPPKSYDGQKIDIKADVTWLACKEACIPGSANLDLSLPVAAKAELNPAIAKQFEEVRADLPQAASVPLTAKVKKGEIAINVKPPGEVGKAEFFPTQKDVIDYNAPQQMTVERGGVTLNMKQGSEKSQEVAGVLVLFAKNSPEKWVYHVDTHARELAKGHISGMGMALIFAFLGGLILNVMPCVLPVIALKIFSFVKMAGEDRRKIMKHGGVFTMGVIISFWVLSGVLLALRFLGHGVGWGFQLQEPLFVAAMIGILFLLGLSLFGVFELGTSLISLGSKTSVKSSPYTSSFLSGVLATLVATPCTGPLLGPALGFAMTLPVVSSMLIFTVMGFGMASPYLLFSAFPQLIRFLPKPGNWMTVFKAIMGFLMMATVTWLLWVFAAQASHTALFVLLMGLVIVGVGAWVYGRWGTPVRKKATRTIATIMAAILIGSAGLATLRATQKFPAVTHKEHVVGWDQYSPERVQQLRAEGKPVFVDFTAKWCLICQANKVPLHNSEKAFEAKQVVTMTADWTNKDPVISKELEKLGRTGVPVYVLYPADTSKAPIILPQTLNSKVIHDYLQKINDH